MTYTPQRPTTGENASYYQGYIDQAVSADFIQDLKDTTPGVIDFLKRLDAEKWAHRYAPEKWSIAEVILHIIDTERIMAYRALRIARNDKTPMPGFDQNDYVPYSYAHRRSPASIIEEFEAVRKSSILLFEQFDDEQLNHRGIASNSPFTPRALGFILVGHQNHHLKVIKDRYL